MKPCKWSPAGGTTKEAGSSEEGGNMSRVPVKSEG